MDLPSSAHFVYIPGLLILGLVIGFIWGARLTRESFVLEAKRQQERQDRKAERARQRAEQAAAGTPADKPPDRA
jgi:hypothetical protein